MALTGETFMERDHHKPAGCIGLAAAAILRERYPFHTAKLIARDLRCTVRAAENLLAGHLSARTLRLLLASYGPELIVDATLAAADSSLDHFIRQKAANAEQERARWELEALRFTQLQADLITRGAQTVAGPSSPGR